MYLFWILVCTFCCVSPPYFLIITCLFVSLYPILHLYFYSDLQYRRLPHERQMHVISNRMIAVVMFCLLPGIAYGWEESVIMWSGLLYTAVHTAALVMTSSGYVLRTKRLIMISFVSAVPYIDFQEPTPACAAVVYFCFECLMFWITYVSVDNVLTRRAYVFDVHVVICTCSWLWQLYYMAVNDMSFWGVVWVSCLVVLVNNDVITLQR